MRYTYIVYNLYVDIRYTYMLYKFYIGIIERNIVWHIDSHVTRLVRLDARPNTSNTLSYDLLGRWAQLFLFWVKDMLMYHKFMMTWRMVLRKVISVIVLAFILINPEKVWIFFDKNQNNIDSSKLENPNGELFSPT